MAISSSYEQMCDAVSRNDFETAKQLMDDHERRFDGHLTFLMRACLERKKAIVHILLNSGVAVDKTDFYGRTALMCAAATGDEDIFELLLKHNADVMKKSQFGCTVFHVAAQWNRKNILNRLLVLMVDEHCSSASSSPTRTASFMLTVDIEDTDGRTPLWWAACSVHVDCVDVLLIHGANPDHKDKKCISPLDIAKQKGHTAVVNKLSESIRLSHFGLAKDRVISELKLEIHRHEEKIQRLEKAGQTYCQEILDLKRKVSKLSNELKMMKSEGGNKQAVQEVSLPLQTLTDSKVHTQQLLTVAKKVAGDWEQLASWLSAEYFTMMKMKEIREDHSTSSAFIRARAVLEMWSTEFGRNATCQQLIRALCQMDQRATAVEVFGCRFVDSLHPL